MGFIIAINIYLEMGKQIIAFHYCQVALSFLLFVGKCFIVDDVSACNCKQPCAI